MAMSDPDGSKVSIGAPRCRIDRTKDAGLTRGLYQASRTIRRVRGCPRISERPHTIGHLVQPQLERDPFWARGGGKCTGKMARARRGPRQCMAPMHNGLISCLLLPGGELGAPRHHAPCVLFDRALRCIASGLLHWAAGVITDFSAGNVVLGCIRLPTCPASAPVACRRSRRRVSLVECRGALANEPPAERRARSHEMEQGGRSWRPL